MQGSKPSKGAQRAWFSSKSGHFGIRNGYSLLVGVMLLNLDVILGCNILY